MQPLEIEYDSHSAARRVSRISQITLPFDYSCHLPANNAIRPNGTSLMENIGDKWLVFVPSAQVNGIMTNTGHSVIFYTGNWDEENGAGGLDSENTLAGLGGVRGISDTGFLGSSGSVGMGGGMGSASSISGMGPGGGGGHGGVGMSPGSNGPGGGSGNGGGQPKTLVNITGGPLSYRYQFHEIHIHYGMRDEAGSEHTVDGYAFPAEVQKS